MSNNDLQRDNGEPTISTATSGSAPLELDLLWPGVLFDTVGLTTGECVRLPRLFFLGRDEMFLVKARGEGVWKTGVLLPDLLPPRLVMTEEE